MLRCCKVRRRRLRVTATASHQLAGSLLLDSYTAYRLNGVLTCLCVDRHQRTVEVLLEHQTGIQSESPVLQCHRRQPREELGCPEVGRGLKPQTETNSRQHLLQPLPADCYSGSLQWALAIVLPRLESISSIFATQQSLASTCVSQTRLNPESVFVALSPGGQGKNRPGDTIIDLNWRSVRVASLSGLLSSSVKFIRIRFFEASLHTPSDW